MDSGMNPWYQAWLQPDCMVGANTNARRAMAQNKPLSDTFKQRLRPCMGSDEYTKLLAGAAPVSHTARMPRSHRQQSEALAQERWGSAQASSGPASVNRERSGGPSSARRPPAGLRASIQRISPAPRRFSVDSQRTVSATPPPPPLRSRPRPSSVTAPTAGVTETRVPSAEIRKIMQRGTNPVVAEAVSRAREAIGTTERRRDNGEKKREKQKVNQDAREFYKELRSIVLQAGAGSTPDERSALTTTAHAVERYIDQNGQLLNKKVTTDLQALRHRCERLATPVQAPVRERAESVSGDVSISTAAGSGSIKSRSDASGGGPVERSQATRRKAANDVFYELKATLRHVELQNPPDADVLLQDIVDSIAALLAEDGDFLAKTRVGALRRLERKAREVQRILSAPVTPYISASSEVDSAQQRQLEQEAVAMRRQNEEERVDAGRRLDRLTSLYEAAPRRKKQVKKRRRLIVESDSDDEG